MTLTKHGHGQLLIPSTNLLSNCIIPSSFSVTRTLVRSKAKLFCCQLFGFPPPSVNRTMDIRYIVCFTCLGCNGTVGAGPANNR